MNWTTTVLVVAIMGLLGLYAFEKRAENKESKHQAEVADHRADSVARASVAIVETLRSKEAQLKAASDAERFAKAEQGTFQLETMLRLRGLSVQAQQHEQQLRLVNAGLLSSTDTLAGRHTPLVRDSLRQTAITTAIAQRDTLAVQLPRTRAVLASTQKALADTSALYHGLDSEVGLFLDTKGLCIACGKKKRLKRFHNALHHRPVAR